MIDKIIKVSFVLFVTCAVYVLISTDRNPPQITINEKLPTKFLYGSSEPIWSSYFTIEDDKDGIIATADYEIDTSQIDFNETGTQYVNVSVTDTDGNRSEDRLKIIVSSGYLATGFEEYEDQEAFTRDLWTKAGFDPANWDNGLEERGFVTNSESASGDNSLAIEYPKDAFGSEETGVQVELDLLPSDEYYSSYKIKFSEDFSWGSEKKGGKLPGLTGGDRCGDDFKCDGTDGFGARFMWRNEGEPEVYLYSADMENEQYGDDIPFMLNGEQVQFETDKWYTITEHVKINSSPTADDGVVEVWLDGEQVIDLDDITFVTDDQLIDTFYFSTFHGGHDETWSPTNDSTAYFDDLKISLNKTEVDFE